MSAQGILAVAADTAIQEHSTVRSDDKWPVEFSFVDGSPRFKPILHRADSVEGFHSVGQSTALWPLDRDLSSPWAARCRAFPAPLARCLEARRRCATQNACHRQ